MATRLRSGLILASLGVWLGACTASTVIVDLCPDDPAKISAGAC